MRAIVYTAFEGPLDLIDVPEPTPKADGVVVRVEATGLCLSDWHGWMGHDPDIALPHIPGHELAGTVVEIGGSVSKWRIGDRVTVPFVAGCGACEDCKAGNEQVCDDQFQPGFTGSGSFAEFVALRFADRNLVAVPDAVETATAATLGCRFATAFRAVVDQGRVSEGEWVAVHGCGGVGLAALMIARAHGAQVVAIDPDPEARAFAVSLGAEAIISEVAPDEIVDSVRAATGGGPHLSIDAVGHPAVVGASVASLRRRGRHVQVGLLPANATLLPMGTVIGRELEILGSHGMQAHRYPEMLQMITDGRLAPDRLVTRTISLEEVPSALPAMGDAHPPGITVVDTIEA